MRSYVLTMLFVSCLCSLSTAQTKVIAHRGSSGIAPENTLSAFQQAIDQARAEMRAERLDPSVEVIEVIKEV